MSDTFSGKGGKVKVMYVRAEEQSDGHKGSTKGRRDKAGQGRKENRWGDRNVPKSPTRNHNEKPARSAWQAKLQDVSEPETAAESTKKPRIDPEQLRRQRNEESKVYGENACHALFANRPEAIVRAYFTQEVTPRFRNALRWLAANRRAYHVVDAREINKVSGTEHHGGVCFIIKKRQGLSVREYLRGNERQTDCIVAIEDVGNPHNLGGMMRSAAHFGVNAVMINQPDLLESGAAIRTAEGGAEHLQAISFDDFSDALAQLQRAGYTVITTSSHQGEPLSRAKLPAKAVFVLGQESDGLSDTVLEQGDMSIAIDGSGKVESLNVSVATGILLAEWWRQTRK
jgi:TrmH RNA methyltransferase